MRDVSVHAEGSLRLEEGLAASDLAPHECVAHAPTDLAWALDEIERLRKATEATRSRESPKSTAPAPLGRGALARWPTR